MSLSICLCVSVFVLCDVVNSDILACVFLTEIKPKGKFGQVKFEKDYGWFINDCFLKCPYYHGFHLNTLTAKIRMIHVIGND